MRWGPGVFEALKNRTLDGLMVNVDSGYMLNVHKTAPNIVASKDLWLGHVYLLVMNRKTWQGLAQEDKDAIGRAAETSYKALGPIMDASFDTMVKDIAREGASIRLLNAREVDGFETAAKYRAVQDTWARTQEAKGVKDVVATMEKVRAMLNDAVK